MNTDNFPQLAAFISLGIDPDETLWQYAYTGQGGEGDYRTFLDLDAETEIPLNAYFAEGQEQGMRFCHALYAANGIGEIEGQDGNVCCQYYTILAPDF